MVQHQDFEFNSDQRTSHQQLALLFRRLLPYYIYEFQFDCDFFSSAVYDSYKMAERIIVCEMTDEMVDEAKL